jgi:hypothetical protein
MVAGLAFQLPYFFWREMSICVVTNRLDRQPALMLPRTHGLDMASSTEEVFSPLRRQVIDAIRRARRLPVGPERNDLRQLVLGLRWLEKKGLEAKAMNRCDEELEPKNHPEGCRLGRSPVLIPTARVDGDI